jgi:hypothetical protein
LQASVTRLAQDVYYASLAVIRELCDRIHPRQRIRRIGQLSSDEKQIFKRLSKPNGLEKESELQTSTSTGGIQLKLDEERRHLGYCAWNITLFLCSAKAMQNHEIGWPSTLVSVPI